MIAVGCLLFLSGHVHEKQNTKIWRTFETSVKGFFVVDILVEKKFFGVNKLILNKDWYLKEEKDFLKEVYWQDSVRNLRLFPVKINSFEFEII